VPDRAVLAARIQRLQAHQHPVGILRGQPPLIISQQPDTGLQQLPAILLLHKVSLVPRIEIPGQVHPRSRLDPQRPDQLRDPLRPLIRHRQSLLRRVALLPGEQRQALAWTAGLALSSRFFGAGLALAHVQFNGGSGEDPPGDDPAQLGATGEDHVRSLSRSLPSAATMPTVVSAIETRAIGP